MDSAALLNKTDDFPQPLIGSGEGRNDEIEFRVGRPYRAFCLEKDQGDFGGSECDSQNLAKFIVRGSYCCNGNNLTPICQPTLKFAQGGALMYAISGTFKYGYAVAYISTPVKNCCCHTSHPFWRSRSGEIRI